MKRRLTLLLFIFLAFFSFSSFAAPASYNKIFADNNCLIGKHAFDVIITEVKKKSDGAVRDLKDCLQLNRKLMFQASLIDPSQFQYAAQILREDEKFVYRLLKVNPEILKFISPKLLRDKDFMKRATYLQRESLQYANPKLLDNRIFMGEMIIKDYKNYIFASDRLKKDVTFAKMALHDNGLYLEQAPAEIKDNKDLVKIAVNSNSEALKFASVRLQKDKELQALTIRKTSIPSVEKLDKFLEDNYLDASNQKNIGPVLAHRMKFFADNKIVDRRYITKWQKFFKKNDNQLTQQVKLIAVDSRNYPVLWKDDFKEYPGVIDKIEQFFLSHQIDQNTVDSLSTTYLWKVKEEPLTLVFNVYLLRDSGDAELGPEFSNVSSLTAIVQKGKEKWKMSVVDVIFDSELKMDIAFPDGHKKFDLWDLYVVDENDKNPKIIFRSEGRFREFLEVFEEQNGGKYNMIYRTGLQSARDHLD